MTAVHQPAPTAAISEEHVKVQGLDFPAAAFTYSSTPMRVRFGPGSFAELGEELEQLGFERVLVLTSPEQHELGLRTTESIGERAAGLFSQARQHVPVERAEAAIAHAQRIGVDACLAVGGGSAIGLGKAIALRTGLPLVAVPTTYAGSEMTPIWGLTEGRVKRTGRDDRVLPVGVVYDPELTLSLPSEISALSGVNAMAHAVEALYAPDLSPIVALLAGNGIGALRSSLPTLLTDPEQRDARASALYGAWLCGACLGQVTMSLHHKLCHTVGGRLDLPHAPAHAALLPYTFGYNAPAAPFAAATLAREFETDRPVHALWEFVRGLGAPAGLVELGVQESDLPGLVAAALENPYANPRPLDAEALTDLLHRAWSGEPPR